MNAKIIIVTIVAIMMLFAWNPLYLGLVYIFIRPLIQPIVLEHHYVLGIPISSALPLFVIGYGIFVSLAKQRYTIAPPHIIPLYLLLFFSLASIFTTSDYYTSITHVIKLFVPVSIYLIFYNAISTKKDAQKVLFTIVISSLILMLYGYYQYLSGAGGRGLGDSSNRVHSVLTDANAYGEFLCLSIVAALMLLTQETRRFRKVFFILMIASMVYSSVLALNRGSWIAFTAALLISSYAYREKVKFRIIVASGIIIAVFLSPIIIGRFLELGETSQWGQSRDTFSGRIDIWKSIIELYLDRPLFGFGIGSSREILNENFGIRTIPHNDYLRILMEVGLLGFISYVVFLFRILRKNIRYIRDKKNWNVNFSMLVLIIYWIIISGAQNIIFDVIVFPMFMALLAVSEKWNTINQPCER